MNKQKLYEKSNPQERRQYLRDGADKIEKFTYMKRFKPDEIESFKTILSNVAIEIDAIDAEKSVVRDEFKTRLDPLKKQLKEILTWIRDKAQSVTEECFLIYNFDTSITEYYNEDGEMVYSRPMDASERQKTIFSIDKTGTNN